jgi:hypothetical protein
MNENGIPENSNIVSDPDKSTLIEDNVPITQRNIKIVEKGYQKKTECQAAGWKKKQIKDSVSVHRPQKIIHNYSLL